MKVLLVQSYLGGNEPLVFPLGLACLKAALSGHEVEAFDCNASARPFEDLAGHLRRFAPDVVGISLRNIDSTNKRTVIFYYPYLGKAIDVVRSCGDARVVVGGSGFSMFAREIMDADDRIDYGVYLEGEHTLPALLDHLDAPESVPSVFCRRDGEVRFSGARAPGDMCEVALPDRLVVPPDAYAGVRDAVGVETKRGCALNCIYCVYGFLNGRAYRLRDPVSVADDVARLVEAQGVSRFMFVDSVFNMPRAHAEAVCNELTSRRLPVKWSAWFSEREISRELLDCVSAAGCDHVILSPDALHDPVLRKLGKSMTHADIMSTFALLREDDRFEVSYNFFKNPPGQTLGHALALLRFCFSARRSMGRRVHFEFSSIRIEPHTGIHRLAVEEGVVPEDVELLTPRYYTNGRTRYIDMLFNAMLILKGK